MITRGSKYFYGAAAVGYLTALVYGFITGASAHGGVFEVFSNGGVVDSIVGPISFGWKGWVGEHVGYATLMGFAGSMLVLGGFCSAFRDGSAEALVEIQGGNVSDGTVTGADVRIGTPSGLSPWPIVTAVSAGAVVVGAAASTTVLVLGCIGLAIAAFEWTVRAWSERATGDPERNREIRNRFMHPIEIPVGATLFIAVIVLSMSRILLAVPKTGAVFLIIILAAAIFGLAILLAGRQQLTRSMLVSALLIGGLLIVAGGIAAGIAGPRESGEEGAPLHASVTAGAPYGSIEPDGASVGN